MVHLGCNNVHPQEFTDNYVKNFSVNVKKTTFFNFLLKTCGSYPNFWNFSKKKLQLIFWAQNETNSPVPTKI